MTRQATDQAEVRDAAAAVTPPSDGARIARLAISGAVGVLLFAAVYLIAVRGEALLIDLAKLGAALCF